MDLNTAITLAIVLLPFLPIAYVVIKEGRKTKAQRDRNKQSLKAFNDLIEEAKKGKKNG